MGLPTEAGTTSSLENSRGKKKKTVYVNENFWDDRFTSTCCKTQPTINGLTTAKPSHDYMQHWWKGGKLETVLWYIIYIVEIPSGSHHKYARVQKYYRDSITRVHINAVLHVRLLLYARRERWAEKGTADLCFKCVNIQQTIFLYYNIYISFCGWRRAVHTRVACIHESCARKMAGRWKLTRLHMKKLPRGSVIERVPAFVRLHSSRELSLVRTRTINQNSKMTPSNNCFYIEVRLADCHTQIFFLEGRFPLGTINEMWLNDIM